VSHPETVTTGFVDVQFRRNLAFHKLHQQHRAALGRRRFIIERLREKHGRQVRNPDRRLLESPSLRIHDLIRIYQQSQIRTNSFGDRRRRRSPALPAMATRAVCPPAEKPMTPTRIRINMLSSFAFDRERSATLAADPARVLRQDSHAYSSECDKPARY
jgi:hypothetical protein